MQSKPFQLVSLTRILTLNSVQTYNIISGNDADGLSTAIALETGTEDISIVPAREQTESQM